MIKVILLLSTWALFIEASVIPEKILTKSCLKSYQTAYKTCKKHKAFVYARESDTGKDRCNWSCGYDNIDKAVESATKGCKSYLLNSECKPIDKDGDFIAKEGDFTLITQPDDTPLSKREKEKLIKVAQKTIKGNCFDFFKKYLDLKGHKTFAYAIDSDGKFACGNAYNYSIKEFAIKTSLASCKKDHPKKHPKTECKLYAQGNKILLSLKDYNLTKEENIIKDLPTPQRDALYEKVAMFIDSPSCRSALRIYLYPHQQQAFYAAIDKDGKQACGFSYAKFSLEDAQKSAKKSCEKKKEKLKIDATCKPLFKNLKIVSKEKDFGIKRGEKDYKNALTHGNLIRIKSYIDEGMDVNIVNKDGVGALFISAAQGDFDFFQKLIKKGANIKQKAHKGNSILTAASLGGDANIVRYLIKKGLDINHQGSDKNTPLHAAFMMLKTYIVEILMQEGADATIKNSKGISAYDLAKKWKINLDELKTIDPKKSDHEGTLPLFYAAKEGDIEGIKKLLAKGADINNADSEKRSPLSYAHIRVLEMLVKAGADVNHQDEDGVTPLMENSNNKSKIELLLKLGADKSIKDKNGKTAYDEVKDDKSVSKEIKRLLKP